MQCDQLVLRDEVVGLAPKRVLEQVACSAQLLARSVVVGQGKDGRLIRCVKAQCDRERLESAGSVGTEFGDVQPALRCWRAPRYGFHVIVAIVAVANMFKQRKRFQVRGASVHGSSAAGLVEEIVSFFCGWRCRKKNIAATQG